MTNHGLKTLMAGGKAAAIVTLLGTSALAQTSVTDTEAVIVPQPALEAESSMGVISEAAPRTLEQMDNDQNVAETLLAQGFSDIYILREGPMMTVTAQRDGQPIELVYSVANGSLVSVNGEELRAEGEGSSANDVEGGEAAADDGATDDGMTDGGDMSDDGATDDGATDDGMGDDSGTDGGSADDGSSDGSDSSTGDDGAGDADGADGADSGGDAGSDGGDSGSDGSDSDGGDSDGGSDGGSDSGGESDGGTNG